MPFIPSGGGGGGASTLVDLTDTPAGYGGSGQVLASNGTDAVAWADVSVPNTEADWAKDPGVIDYFGDGAAYYDLGTGDDSDGLATADDVGTVADGYALRYATNGTTTLVGRYLSDVGGGDFVAGIRMRTTLTGPLASDSTTLGAFLSVFLGTDRTVDVHRSVGPYRRNDTQVTSGIGYVQGGTRGTALTSSASSNSGYLEPKVGGIIDLFVQLSGTALRFFFGPPGGGLSAYFQWTITSQQAAAAKQLVTMAAVSSTSHKVTVDVLKFAPPGVFTSVPMLALDS